jgi:hypothetical protein
MSLNKLAWDTRKTGDERARLTPWSIPAHKAFLEGELARLRAVGQTQVADAMVEAYKNAETKSLGLHEAATEKVIKQAQANVEAEAKAAEEKAEKIKKKADKAVEKAKSVAAKKRKKATPKKKEEPKEELNKEEPSMGEGAEEASTTPAK